MDLEAIISKFSKLTKEKEHIAYIKGDTRTINAQHVVNAISKKEPNLAKDIIGIYKLKKKFRLVANNKETIDKLLEFGNINVKNVDLKIEAPIPEGERYRFCNVPPSWSDSVLGEFLNSFGTVIYIDRERIQDRISTGKVFVVFSAVKADLESMNKLTIGKYDISITKIKKNSKKTAPDSDAQEPEEENGEKTEDINEIRFNSFDNAYEAKFRCWLSTGGDSNSEKIWLKVDVDQSWSDHDLNKIMKLLNASEWKRSNDVTYFKLQGDPIIWRYHKELIFYYTVA